MTVVGARRVGLVVGTLVGEQDVVIKALGPSLKGVRGFAGASELGDQRIALVIDAPALIDENLAGSSMRSGASEGSRRRPRPPQQGQAQGLSSGPASRTAAPAPSTSPSCSRSDIYGAPVALIREILKPPPLTPVPRTPHHILGIVSVRGQLVTVVDLRRRLHLEEAPSSRKSRILLVDATGGEVMGILVDEVLQVYRLADSEIEPAAVALGGETGGYISGIARPITGVVTAPIAPRVPGIVRASALDATVVVLLDLHAILS